MPVAPARQQSCTESGQQSRGGRAAGSELCGKALSPETSTDGVQPAQKKHTTAGGCGRHCVPSTCTACGHWQEAVKIPEAPADTMGRGVQRGARARDAGSQRQLPANNSRRGAPDLPQWLPCQSQAGLGWGLQCLVPREPQICYAGGRGLQTLQTLSEAASRRCTWPRTVGTSWDTPGAFQSSCSRF